MADNRYAKRRFDSREDPSEQQDGYPSSYPGRKPYSKRFHSGLKGRSTLPSNPEDVLHNLIFLVGQKSTSSISENIRSLCKALLIEASRPHVDDFFSTIIECMSHMAWKTRIYSSVVGLLNIQEPALIKNQFLPKLQRSIDRFLVERQSLPFVTSLRFLADLVTVNVVEGLSFIQTIEPLVVYLETSSNDHAKVKSFVLYSVLSSFLWNASSLMKSNEGIFRTLLVRIGNIMLEVQSSKPHRADFVPDNLSHDNLDELYSFFKDMDSWENSLNDQILPELMELSSTNLSPHQIHPLEIDSLYDTQTALEFSGLHTRNTFKLASLPSVDMNIECSNNESDEEIGTNASPQFTIKRNNLENWILTDIVSHTIDTFEYNYRKCAEFIVLDIQYLFSSAEIPAIAINCILSEMLSCPHPSKHPTVYYTMLIKEILALSDSAGEYLGAAVTRVFMSLDQLLYSQLVIFSSWLAHHLSQFEYKWNWWMQWEILSEKNPHGFSLEPSIGLQALFLQTTFSNMIRLSYYEQIRAIIPDFFVPYLQSPPEPCFDYSESSATATPEELAFSRKLGEGIKSRLSSSELLESISAFSSLPNRNNIIVQSVLLYGSKSFSHTKNAIDRYFDLLELSSSNMDSQIQFLGFLGKFWKLSPPYIQVIIDHLMEHGALSVEAILNWLERDILENSHHESWGWELLKEKLASNRENSTVISFLERFIANFRSKTVAINSPDTSFMLWIKINFQKLSIDEDRLSAFSI